MPLSWNVDLTISWSSMTSWSSIGQPYRLSYIHLSYTHTRTRARRIPDTFQIWCFSVCVNVYFCIPNPNRQSQRNRGLQTLANSRYFSLCCIFCNLNPNCKFPTDTNFISTSNMPSFVFLSLWMLNRNFHMNFLALMLSFCILKVILSQ